VRVAIDARPAVARGKTGVGWYAWHLIRRLPEVDPETTYLAWYLYARRLVGEPLFFRDVRAPNFVEQWTPFPARLFWRLSKRGFPRVEWLAGFDVLFATNFVPPPTRGRPIVLTVHDLAFRRHPSSVPAPTRAWLDARLGPALERAAGILVPSEATRRDLLELYGVDEERVTVTPLGVDHATYRPVPPERIRTVRERLGIPASYLLYVGGIEPRKNVSTLIRAFAAVSGDVRAALVVAGAAVGWDRQSAADVRGAIDALPARVRDRIVLTGYLSEADKVALLSGTRAFVYPSLYEGFGLPVAEAMASGAPVLTSNVSALPETAGDAALLVDPEDQDEVADGIRRLLADEPLRDRLRAAGLDRAAGFTWDETARRTAEVLRHSGGR